MSQKRIDDIVFLRGCAILLVLVCHTRNALIVWPSASLDRFYSYIGGGSGVDLFFVISGFVIARSLYPELVACRNARSRAFVTLAFWTRRAWRIVPSAWLWLALILLAVSAFNNSGAFHSLPAALKGTIAAIFQVHNYWLVKCFGHFDCGANFYYWSLSLEEQFYLLLPLAVIAFRRYFNYVIALLAVVQILHPDRQGVLLAFRTDGLLLGVLIALWWSKGNGLAFERRFLAVPPWLCMVSTVILLSLFAADIRLFASPAAPLAYGILALSGAALVLIGSFDRNLLFPDNAVKRVFMWIGMRSWSLYLVHIPAFLLTREIWFRLLPDGEMPSVAMTTRFLLTGAGLLIVLGELNYRLVEVPSREKGAKISARFLEKHLGISVDCLAAKIPRT